MELNIPEEVQRLNKIILENKDKNFIQRILNPKIFPVMNNPDGSYSTHKMASGEIDGKGIAFPTIIQDPDTGKLIDLTTISGDPMNYAMKTGNYIQFDKPKDAEWFSTNYKKIWKYR